MEWATSAFYSGACKGSIDYVLRGHVSSLFMPARKSFFNFVAPPPWLLTYTLPRMRSEVALFSVS
jgi:hypothetical protein